MDFSSLNQLRDGLQQELVTLKEDPIVEVPLLSQFVELEITQLNKMLQSMGKYDVHVDGSLIIGLVLNEFELSNASAADLLSKHLMEDLNVLNLWIQPQLICIDNFIRMVLQRLGQVSRELMAMIHNVGTKPASVDDSQSQVVGGSSSSGPVSSTHKTEGQGSGSSPQPVHIFAGKNLDWCCAYAIDTVMKANPEDFHADQVIEYLRGTSTFNVDNGNVRRVITQKCNEAIESRNKKLAQGDQCKCGSKQG